MPSLHRLHKNRQALVNKVLRSDPLIIGTVYDVLRRCGNPSCHCAEKPAHRQTLLISILKGKRCCQFVRQADVDWVRQAWARYKDLRQLLKQIRALNQRELGLLEAQIKKRRIPYK